MIAYTKITEINDIDMLLGKESAFANLHYKYERETIDMLKRNFFRSDSLYTIVKENGQFVAFCSTDSDWWEPQYFFLREIFVMPTYQRQRIGETLLKESINHAETCNANGIVTETAFENIPMQNLCERNGFKRWENPQWKEGVTYKLIFKDIDSEQEPSRL